MYFDVYATVVEAHLQLHVCIAAGFSLIIPSYTLSNFFEIIGHSHYVQIIIISNSWIILLVNYSSLWPPFFIIIVKPFN
ncbi:unnamed protein product [Citrullus colocynthis]|uniref:Uncharacterized protein n=1 Tax=Citrullus colocynthis TaxID=252529 RepID=A0ABP0YVI6_9ROSI